MLSLPSVLLSLPSQQQYVGVANAAGVPAAAFAEKVGIEKEKANEENAAAQIEAETIPIDAVIYGGANESGLIDAEGETPEPHVADVSGGESIVRTVDGWAGQDIPTPNDCSQFE